ncbi:MAG: COX15/CtaA family protein, partial [Terrimicrobiaceae bacterium]|nr:COX15/CtaA family protein [Terrimicrobiaceae bacterium]
RRAVGVAVALTFLQLALGATMRHEHIGLAVPDFPLAYGRILPDTSPAAIAAINARRADEGQVPIQPEHVWVHLAHRAMAVGVCGAVFWVLAASGGAAPWVRRTAWLWSALVVLQFALGAWTVLSGKSVAMATAHMALGALLLALGVVFAVRLRLSSRLTMPAAALRSPALAA